MKKSFTIAEVLITLGIIGVIAAMTIPQMIKHYRKVETETRLKRAYTILSQAFIAAQAKYGDADDWLDWDDSLAIIKNYLAPEIKNVKIYSYDNNICYEGKYTGNHYWVDKGEPVQYAWMNGIHISNPFYSGVTASFQLQDGTCIAINGTSESTSYENQKKNIMVDINGSLGRPNIAGQDLFFFVFKDNRIMPYGYDWDYQKIISTENSACNPRSSSGAGYTCAARIMAEGWTINYW